MFCRKLTRSALLALLPVLIGLLFGLGPASAAERPPWTSSRLVGTPTPPHQYRLLPAFPGIRFEKPTSIEELPGQRLLVTEIGGKLFSFPKQKTAARADMALVGDLKDLLPSAAKGQNVSLFDAELHPAFAENHYLFVCYVHPGNGGHTRVSRFTLSNDPPQITPESELVVITWPAGGHNGGCLEFGTDGYLYISTGDGSGPNPPDALTTGQDISDLLGAVLRIDVDHAAVDAAYSVPPDNPFVNIAGARPEIWAYGLRNPWKFGVDEKTGDMFVADNGWETWEMVHRIVRGGNCGWPTMEGRAVLRSEVPPGPTPIIPPVKDHPHTEANSVIGGPVYRGKKLSQLNGSFVYGDYITGTIWAVQADSDHGYSHETLVDTEQRVIAFTQGSQDELFVLDYDVTGQVYELVPSLAVDRSANFPRRLSDTGLFASVADLTPAPGVVPYDVCAGRWMDGAVGQRWVAVPGSARIELSAESNTAAVFPDGTVFVKHLSLPQPNGQSIPLETQVLQYDEGVWNPYSYLWDETGSDAQLVDAIGANRTIQAANPESRDQQIDRSWHVNAANECKLCHNAGAGFVLGFNPQQLNIPSNRAGSDRPELPQLAALADQGVIQQLPGPAVNNPFQLVNPHDTANELEDRARSYLHVNCSMCHHPAGNAIVSFYLRRDLPLEKLNTNKGTGIGTFGIHDAKIIVSGDPYRSILLYRMSKLGYARMPYIGSQVVDSSGVTLVEQWIRSLAAENNQLLAPALPADSPAAQALDSLLSERSISDADCQQAAETLIASTEGSLALAMELHRSRIQGKRRALIIQIAAAAPASDIRGLFETFIPEGQRRPTLGARIDPLVILEREGNAERGKLIYYSDNARCRSCHEIDNRDKSLGPTLQEINKKYMGLAEMLEHILQPSLKIDEAFKGAMVATVDGKIHTGLIVEQNEQQIVLEDAQRRKTSIARENIDELHASDQSLMPTQILSDLTAQEAADLLAYIRSLGTGE